MQRIMRETQLAGFITFLITGVVVSGVVSALFGNIISWTEATLIVVSAISLLAGIFYYALSNRRIQLVADSLDSVTLNFVEEPFHEPEIRFRGIFYSELEKLVRSAEKEILVYGCTYVEGVFLSPIWRCTPRASATL